MEEDKNVVRDEISKIKLPTVQEYDIDPSTQGYDSLITNQLSIEYLALDVQPVS